jgi:dTDP-glucose 4,6-dehydratase
MENILVTGGCGFIGSHFIEHILKTYPEARVTNVDALTYAAHPDMPAHLEKIAPERYDFVQADIATENFKPLLEEQKIDSVVNFAAETHVDRSILDPGAFVRTNIVGVENLVRAAREVGGNRIRFVHVSTDEVYGSLSPEDPQFTEKSPLEANSPYSASKASADLLLLACERTYKQPILITRCTNNYGPHQFPEKLLPLLIANALEDLPIPVYGDGLQVRDWIYVEDHCRGIDAVLQKGQSGHVYNISSNEERPNIEVIRKVLEMLSKPSSLITYVGDRPAHDRRYGLSAMKIRKELGWKPLYTFEDGLRRTIDWYLGHQEWWKKVRTKDYFKYYEANYNSKFSRKPEVSA